MIWMRFAPYIAAGAVVIGGYLYVNGLQNKIDAQEAQIASQERSIRVLNDTAEKTRQAQRVAAERAQFWEERSQVLDASIEALITGDIPDAPLDPRIADIVNGWLSEADD